MTAAVLLALSLATAPLAQEDWETDAFEDERGEAGPRIHLTAWGGEVLEDGGGGRSSSFLGGEAAWAFDGLDLGLAAYGYRELSRSTHEWTPVVLVRLAQRFRTRRGVEASFGIGVGAARTDGWEAWFQAALGVRLRLGPAFVAGELAFEQVDLLRLGAGFGVSF